MACRRVFGRLRPTWHVIGRPIRHLLWRTTCDVVHEDFLIRVRNENPRGLIGRITVVCPGVCVVVGTAVVVREELEDVSRREWDGERRGRVPGFPPPVVARGVLRDPGLLVLKGRGAFSSKGWGLQ